MKLLLNSWKQRKLTLIGRILIVKIFAISQFTYLANLTTFSDDRVRQINEVINNYIWNGKTCKVKKNIMIKDQQFGGLRMPDLKSIIVVQKLKWIKLALLNHMAYWKFTMQKLIGVEHLSLFLLSNCNHRDFSVRSMFYKEVLDVWNNVRYIDDTSQEGISRQLIFYNKHLKIGGKYFFNVKFLEVGLWRICDFYEDRNLIPFHVWKNHGLPSILYYKWMCLINAISVMIKQKDVITVHDKVCIMIKLPNKMLSFEGLSSKQLYDILVNKNDISSKAQIKHAEYFDINTRSEEWKSIYLLPHRTVKSNEVKENQFKILHRYIATNRLLFLMNKAESLRCTFCNIHCETIYHLFYECTLLRSIWHHVATSCSKMCRDNIQFTCRNIILEYVNNDIHIDQVCIINMIILYTKCYIMRCKYDSRQPSICGLKIYLEFQQPYETKLKNVLFHW